jgi:outer membrane protein assembly factor BamB
MRCQVVYGTALLLVYLTTAHAAEWPQWRGAARDGVWKEHGPPERFPPEGLTARWRQPVGGGYAGIAVAHGRVYTLDRQKAPREVERVLCLDAATGKTLWTFAYSVSYGKMEYGNGPRSTPTVHDGRVYTFGAVGHLHCLDAVTGKLLWSHDTVKEFQGRVPTWGHACSPLVDGARVLVQPGSEDNACLMAFDRTTGNSVWRTLPDRPGYSSPVLIETPAGRQLIYWTAEHVNGLDPATGKVRWQVPHTTDYDVTISDPIYHDGVLLVSDYWKGSKAIQLDERGLNPKVIWEGRFLSLLMATPLYRDGHLYALDRRDGLKCIELKTGKVKWEGEHVTPKDRNPQASFAWIDANRALILNTPGELLLAELTPAGYRQLSKATVVGKTWANPAFAAGCVFARNDTEIVCVPLR